MKYRLKSSLLPKLLRDHPLPHEAEQDPVDFALSVNCLLYADDVVLIASSAQLPAILQKCEEHSYQLGYRWNPAKCTILAPPEDTQSYTLYNTILPKQNSFPYLEIPICPGGYLHTQELIQGNVNKALKTMNEMAVIGVNPAGFDRLLSVRFYTQIVRPQLEYSLAISMCLRRIFGGGSRSSTQLMLHLVNQSSMKNRVHILQAKFILRSLNLSDDTLFSWLLPYIRASASHSHWYKLISSPLWRVCCNQDIEHLNRQTFRIICRKYLEDLFNQNCQRVYSKLLSACRSQSTIVPILWLSMTSIERSRVVRWRLGWLLGGVPKSCIYHPTDMLTHSQATWRLHKHHRLQMPSTEPDPLSLLLNKLPTKHKNRALAGPKPPSSTPSAWTVRWPTICQILFELDYLHHGKIPSETPSLGIKLVNWLGKT
ncbi:hypothetical protein G6F47_008715 [Rhizopus delemar]|nr:hypothetical protein G6F53_008527 [Rhizopus delemar]KAG1594733.1 hypothetical protein G6F47_008715 [Rhizopus delemar]